MELDDVPPTLATHNAYINVCSQRCRSLVELSANRRRSQYSPPPTGATVSTALHSQ